MYEEAYNALYCINVHTCYYGVMTAFHAFANEIEISRSDEIKVIRQRLKELGFKCVFSGGTLKQIVRL